jgi:hypothetical protein
VAKVKEAPLRRGLFELMKSLDAQVARRMQRSPEQREVEGVQKWGPYEVKTEEVAAMVLDAVANNEVQLDSVLILTRCFTKCLKLLVEELGEENLGNLRSAYCLEVFRAIGEDARLGAEMLGSSARLM